ncbi:PREDICTED: H(+)/Cl(-) exchange transporter 7-like [Rhagoletis zephyria]|uniref:H(+)/Cl(-) exchange transporter 7-like n=1 Tax=Rhagoletis zephyria TaxID=28612 RepID=UPI0008113993|nr:PREDICTED: H(+)/Cl(-) exchange transporter 7-like [Rhagoletis zephyria]
MFDDSVLLEHETNSSRVLSPTSEHYLGATPSTVEIEHNSNQISNLSASFTASGRHNPDAPPSSKFESLDYDQCENMLQVEEEIMSKRNGLDKNLEFTRWIVICMIGILTGLTACFILFSVEELTKFKYTKIMYLFEGIDADPNFWTLMKPYLVWLLSNGFPTLLGSVLVTYMAPVAAGSGIPVIKCYLNGVKVPEVVRIKTYFAKAIGVIGSVTGGLACGKEGPMIHCGASIAAGISQGKSTTFGWDFQRLVGLTRFREDHEKRDFVSAGAAAGVSAAFGAPLGGVLFALEEGASFWNQQLVVRIFFCSLISSFSLNFIVSVVSGQKLGASGLLNFGKFQDIDYSWFEMPIYAAMGAFGGLTGAAWNYLNMKITILRMRYLRSSWSKVAEAVVASLLTASIGFLMIILLGDCYSLKTEETEYPVGYGCPKGQHNVMAALWFNTPEATLRNLFHNKDGTWTAQTLCIFVGTYFFVSCVTYGLYVSAGLFIPGLLLGAAWGRLFGLVLSHLFTEQAWICPGKFALIGASASLGGIVRMTISLTVIIIETTGNLSFGLPIMITVIIAKWVGDLFTESVYDIHIELSRVPFLSWEPPTNSARVYASEVMHKPVVSLKTTETVKTLLNVLINTTHNGFPVVDAESSFSHVRTYGRYRGLILRSQLLVMLKAKIFNEYSLESPWRNMYSLFRNSYPRMPELRLILAELEDHELEYTLDLRPVMNPSAYTVCHAASYNRIFRLFRALGLRHIVVLNDYNEVVGIVTRKDLVIHNSGSH